MKDRCQHNPDGLERIQTQSLQAPLLLQPQPEPEPEPEAEPEPQPEPEIGGSE